jgi:hypothetical protein
MKKTNNGKPNYKLFYLASILLYIASAMSAISGNVSGTSVGLATLFFALGMMYSKKSGDNKDNKDTKDNE